MICCFVKLKLNIIIRFKSFLKDAKSTKQNWKI